MSRWLVAGAGGMLGQDLIAALARDGQDVATFSHRELDIADEAAVRAAVRHCRPELVVNCAAWTAVDDAESHEPEALRVNGQGPAYLAAACADVGSRLMHVSTDYVFAGDACRPYPEDGVTAPRTAYGRTKRAGERAVLQLLPEAGYVVRTAWLYGTHGPNFVRTVIGLADEGPAVTVVDDQRGQPTWAADVADQIIALAGSRAPAGVYHATSSGETTWFGLAQEVFRLLGVDPARVKPATSADYPRPAPRPGYSVLGHDAWAKAGLAPLPDWRASLRRAFPSLAAA